MIQNNTADDKSIISWKSELCRKGIHLLSLSIPTGYFLLNSLVVYIGLGFLLLVFVIYDLLRLLGKKTVKDFLAANFSFLLRPREKKSFSGATAIVLSGLLVFILFDRSVAAASMVIIVVGDIAAAIMGKRFGKIKYFNKSLEGSLAFIAASSIAVLAVPELQFKIAFSGVLVGAFIEAVPIPVDDNLRVPLIAGGVMQLLI